MEEYLKNIAQKYARTDTALGREMIYRTEFEILLKEIFKADGKVTQINHDSTSDKGNKPDFVITKNAVPTLYIEAKDIGVSLDKVEKSNQMERYFGYDNLVLTDYLEFRFYRNGVKYQEPVVIGTFEKEPRVIHALSQNFEHLQKTLVDFTSTHKEPIKSGAHLARIMGGKAQRIRDNVREMFATKPTSFSDLLKMRDVVKEHLVTGLDDETFADMYAQTLVYGLFAARYNDTTPDSFSRAEARELVPKTNPFLRSFFDHIAGESFPDRLRYIVDELCEVFTHADIEKILHDFYGKEKDNKDPIIHFYEDFLKEYDSKKKMDMGVFYTPRPVVEFIVRAVDDILKTEFELESGLSDTSKVTVERSEIDTKSGKERKVRKEYHKVQVLDVATGTGTFLNEVIEHIHRGFVGQEGRWPAYVESDLLPRLHGFELMMASYTIAHLKLGMTLHDTGATNIKERLGVYLTNSLEAPVDYSTQNTLFGIMDSIAEESKNASRVKTEYPIMCVIGNPPYSGVSMNKHYTDNSVYKVEPGGTQKLQEKKHWLDDDYVKFIRFAESLIEKNGEGIVGMITAHGYIDNPTFRGMRWHLRKTFDKIYILDLHGNSNRKEKSPDGSKDENVFDIKTGVSIILGVKKQDTKKEKKLGQVLQTDFFGVRKNKYQRLKEENIESIKWSLLPEESDTWRREGEGAKDYKEGFSIAELFTSTTTGIVTGIDKLSIFLTKEELESTTKAILEAADPYSEFGIKDGRRTRKENRIKELREASHNQPTPISYRPFDTRWMYYTTNSEVWINSPRPEIMKHFIGKSNVGLIFARSQKDTNYSALFISSFVSEAKCGESSTQSAIAPLYLYPETGSKYSAGDVGNIEVARIPNIDVTIARNIASGANAVYYPVAEYDTKEGDTRLTPENILDYVYAVLHSPRYREMYKEFLKSDFPRVPYPKNKEEFWSLVPLGTKLRELHLMESPEAENKSTTYPEVGDNIVEKLSYTDEKVYINAVQYFGNVPESAWNFYVGGYQPAQKWLKDRKDRALSNEEILHYERIITVITETERVMKEIDTKATF